MEFENPVADPYFEVEGKPKENRSGEGNQSGADAAPVVMNGFTNGYPEKHVKKDKHKDKDRHKEHRDKDRHRDKDKERHSSSGKDKDRHSSSKDKDRKHRDEKKDRDEKKSREEKKDGEDKKNRDEKRDKEREERKDKDKEHKSSSSSKDKEHKSSSSSKDKDKHRDKDKDKQHSSSSSKDKERHSSSSKDKHSSSSSSKDKHSSSSDKHRDKHRDKDKPRDKSKPKELDTSREKKVVETPMETSSQEEASEVDNVAVKFEVEEEDSQRLVIKEEPMETETPDESYYNLSAFSRPSIKTEVDTEDDTPLADREIKTEESDDDDVPLLARQKKKVSKKRKAEDDDDFMEAKKKKKKVKVKAEKDVKVKVEKGVKVENEATPGRKKKKEEEAQEVWKWWEEEKKDDGTKWYFLEHKGPVFAPPYERLPEDVKFFYDGKELRLSEGAEEVATFYARMLDHDYTTKEAFNKNFFKDWRKMMTEKERELIKDLSKCNFKHMHAYFVQKSEERKAMSKEEKKKIKEANEEQMKEYGFCSIDGHKERIGNFKIEPPGLFRGRGEHPKMGMLKRRVMPEDIIINCSKGSEVPKAPPGHRWKEVRHDKGVTWLASWTENVQGQVKYIMLNPSSKLKGEKDWQKYETARKLAKCIDKIRQEYREDWKSKEMRIRQRSVALYFIDKLALRAGNEKDEDQADTVGCCSLRVEHISLHEQKDGKENVVVFDFLGKDSIRYYNEVSVEKRVFKNLQLFMENKSTGDDLFDRLNTTVMNKHLNELMEGLTAKVFRTYNASITLQDQLNKLTDPDYTVQEKVLAYNRANRAVAILCNHQRAVPKTHAKSMENLKVKIDTKREQMEEAEKHYKQAKRDSKNHNSAKNKIDMDKRKKQLDRIREQLEKLELQATDKEENKEIALGTSKLNYLDPRISVAWCKKNGVPIEKIYNKTQRDKFRWAIDMAGPDYVF